MTSNKFLPNSSSLFREGFDIGFIDIHSHLLPGIDDGCFSLSDSLECVRQLKHRGFRGTICTPHFGVDLYAGNTPKSIGEGVVALQKSIDSEGLDYQIWAGAEVRISNKTIDYFRDLGVPTLGNSNCVLIDYWDERWEEFCIEVVEYLLERQYQPVLAHPERMPMMDESLEQILVELQELGVWLQGNLRCIAAAEGPVPRSRMEKWLKEGRYQFIATDMHSATCLGPRLAGIEQVTKLVGEEQLNELLVSRIHDLILGQAAYERP